MSDFEKEEGQVDTEVELNDQTQPVVNTDTETETGNTETETETVDNDNPYVNEFEQLGLGSIYSDPIEALRQLKEKDRYIAQIHQERAELNRRLLEKEKRRQPQVDFNSEDFLSNPVNTMKQQGFVTRDEIDEQVNTGIDSYRVKQFVNSTPDFAKYAPAIDTVLSQNPWMLSVPSRADVLELSYRYAKALSAKEPNKVVQPSDADKKGRATTVDNKGGKVRPTGQSKDKFGLTSEDYKKLPLEEIEKRIGIKPD